MPPRQPDRGPCGDIVPSEFEISSRYLIYGYNDIEMLLICFPRQQPGKLMANFNYLFRLCLYISIENEQGERGIFVFPN